MKKRNLSISNITGALIALLLVLQSPVSLANDPPQNIRFEGGLLVWDTVDGAVSYNVYALSAPVNGSGFYVDTVEDVTEYQTTFNGFYTVVAFFGGTPQEFSAITDAEIVDGGDGPRITGSRELFELLGPDPVIEEPNTDFRLSEVRTNRCTNMFAGESCAVMCDANVVSIATGGACRAASGIVLHERAIAGGYECLATADTDYVEVDAICLFPGNF